MFDVCCEHCSTRRILSVSSVRHLVNDEQGIVVVFQCPCGELGAWRTGRAAGRAGAGAGQELVGA